MSDNSSEDEPSIEEILASIRQIISDDDEEEVSAAPEPEPEPEAAAPEPAPAPEPEPAPQPAAAPEPAGEQVLELTEDMQEATPAKPRERIEIDMQDPDTGPAPSISDESIIAGQTAASAMGSMAKIVGSMPVSRSGQFKDYNGVTLEDIVRDMLYPELKQWMDSYLPALVERLVQAELERLTKRFQDLDR